MQQAQNIREGKNNEFKELSCEGREKRNWKRFSFPSFDKSESDNNQLERITQLNCVFLY